MAPDARAIVAALKGRWGGTSGSCRCPAHEDRTPSLSVTRAADGAVLVHCHAGCAQADVIDALKSQGLWPGNGMAAPPRRRPIHDDAEVEKRRLRARNMWIVADLIEGTPGETYLRHRGIDIALPLTLRFNVLKHPTDGLPKPTLICAVQDGSRKVTAVQRIFLNEEGSGKSDVMPAKMTYGPMVDGAVRFGMPSGELGLAEGPETALSAMQLFGMPVWCSCGAGRMKRVALPDVVETVHIFADAGEAGTRAAREALEVFEAQGRKVVVRAPATGDWNDVLRGLA